MDIESTTQVNNKAGFFAQWWGALKALPTNFKSKVINTTRSIKKIGKDDPRRVIHSLKVGVALTLVSLLYYWRPLYDGFGVAGMWAVLTVVVVFEFTVGATLSKSLNRGFATLLAGALGVGGQHLATAFGERGEAAVLGTLVFFLAAGSTFFRFFPKIKARYDYGMVIFILTFCLVAVSGYRVEELLELAHQRLSTIIIGAATCMIISIFICPVWAGEDLHKLVASNIEKLANYLEGFEGEYFHCSEDKEKSKSLLQGYKSVLNSKATEESLTNLARWEPGHGRFRLRHPWKQYLKIGALARECAYKIETLNSYLNPEIQASLEFKCKVQESCIKMSSESNKALKAISSSIKTMTDPSAAKSHIENSKIANEDLKIALETVSLDDVDLLTIIPVATVAKILEEITKSVEKIYESVSELSQLAHFKSVEPNVSPEKPHLLHRGIIKPVVEVDNHHVEITIQDQEIISTDSPEKEKLTIKSSSQRLQNV
ncbi:Aluminum-activated malate transporter [Sesbania bispinosa]|nr:Aluminum-activated malate transporter [Sesbania bispinosa]